MLCVLMQQIEKLRRTGDSEGGKEHAFCSVCTAHEHPSQHMICLSLHVCYVTPLFTLYSADEMNISS